MSSYNYIEKMFELEEGCIKKMNFLEIKWFSTSNSLVNPVLAHIAVP